MIKNSSYVARCCNARQFLRQFANTTASFNETPLRTVVSKKPRDVQIPNVLPRHAQKPVYLISVDKFFNNDIVNWDQIAMEFQKYNAQRNFTNSLLLLNRISESKLTPPPKIVGLIFSFLANHDVKLIYPVILNLFESVIEAKVDLTNVASNSLLIALGKTTDEFGRRAFYELFQQYISYCRSKNRIRLQVEVAYLRSLIEASGLEETQIQFQLVCNMLDEETNMQAKKNALKMVPWTQLLNMFQTRWNELWSTIEVVQKMQQYDIFVPPLFWNVLLQGCIDNRDDSGLDFVWSSAVKKNLFTPTNAALAEVVNLFVDSNSDHNRIPFEAMEALALQDPTSQQTKIRVLHLLELYVLQSTNVERLTIDSFFKILGQAWQMDRSFQIKDISAIIPTVWKFSQSVKASEFVERVLDSCISFDPAEKSIFETFAMNLVLKSCCESRASVNTLNLYRRFIDAGVIPNAQTFEIIALAALKLKHAKKLGYLIYLESGRYNVEMTPLTYSYLLRSSLVGSEMSSTLFYVAILIERGASFLDLAMPSYLYQHAIRVFDECHDQRFTDLVKRPDIHQNDYLEFPSDRTLRRGDNGSRSYIFTMDMSNCSRFLEGFSESDLRRIS